MECIQSVIWGVLYFAYPVIQGTKWQHELEHTTCQSGLVRLHQDSIFFFFFFTSQRNVEMYLLLPHSASINQFGYTNFVNVSFSLSFLPSSFIFDLLRGKRNDRTHKRKYLWLYFKTWNLDHIFIPCRSKDLTPVVRHKRRPPGSHPKPRLQEKTILLNRRTFL